MFKAVQRRSVATVELLLRQRRIHVNQTTTIGNETPPMVVVRLHALAIVELLLGNGANNAPLMIALRRDCTDIEVALETRNVLDVHYDDSFGVGVSGQVYQFSDRSIWTEI
ncbi:hypothetical protein SDRG_02898 [Saprolegnia diclina VS20]|uniref:Uncharacterized protein n=1 Tax=Saprolegnia diclina (strain VS20) TaxID=1156394 RepID=T0SBV2_SAPDV|nr:hypothetical protein SDRG_02898 [Saprolegnia diclina VS20]EQC40252.1 hypothetical protein SDRG_02898 [Saprolegnia diclina VS20]|eukprot:XP_008606726.1 hypothetical protein SDRG_02898 [Saprolegnia diclina VS20]